MFSLGDPAPPMPMPCSYSSHNPQSRRAALVLLLPLSDGVRLYSVKRRVIGVILTLVLLLNRIPLVTTDQEAWSSIEPACVRRKAQVSSAISGSKSKRAHHDRAIRQTRTPTRSVVDRCNYLALWGAE